VNLHPSLRNIRAHAEVPDPQIFDLRVAERIAEDVVEARALHIDATAEATREPRGTIGATGPDMNRMSEAMKVNASACV
jgi:hypothetical protein